MIFGYARISTSNQNLESQVNALLTFGVEKKNIYCDVDSGAKNDRGQLELLLKILRKGDLVVFYDLSRASRDVKHLMNLVDLFHLQGVDFKDLTIPMLDTKYVQTASGELIFLVFAVINQFHRKFSNEKVQNGVDYARSQGRFGGRPKGISKALKDKSAVVAKLYTNTEMKVADIAKNQSMAPNSVYKCLEYQGIPIKLKKNRAKISAQ